MSWQQKYQQNLSSPPPEETLPRKHSPKHHWQDDPAYMDRQDPNYDPEEDMEGVIIDEFLFTEDDQASWKTDNEAQIKYKISIRAEVAKLYEDPTTQKSFVDSVSKDGNDRYRHILVKLLVSSTYGKTEEQRKLITNVLAQLYKTNTIRDDDISIAFGSLFATVMEEGEEAITSLEAMVNLGEQDSILSKATVDRFVRTERVDDANAKLKILKSSLDECFREYFTSGSFEQCAENIIQLNEAAPFHYEVVHYEVVKRGIRMALDKDNKCRELMSRFLAYYTGNHPTAVLQANAVQRGFELLVQSCSDLYMDVPDILYLLSCFIARAVVDEALPPRFVDDCAVSPADMGKRVLLHVQKVLAQKNSYARLDKVWVSGKDKSVGELKASIKSYIREYFTNSDMNDTVCNIKELAVPYFNHEIVKQLIVLACDYKENEVQLSKNLLSLMVSKQLITRRMVQQGFSKVAAAKDDYLPDIPNLPTVYNLLREAVVTCDPNLKIDAMLNLRALPTKLGSTSPQTSPNLTPQTAATPDEDTSPGQVSAEASDKLSQEGEEASTPKDTQLSQD